MVEMLSITIGDHHIDAALTSPILVQVVLHPLRELENVIDVVSQLMSISSHAVGSTTPGEAIRKRFFTTSPRINKGAFVEHLRR